MPTYRPSTSVHAKWEQLCERIQDESGQPPHELECLEAVIDLGPAFHGRPGFAHIREYWRPSRIPSRV